MVLALLAIRVTSDPRDTWLALVVWGANPTDSRATPQSEKEEDERSDTLLEEMNPEPPRVSCTLRYV